ncbi:uncharacterized protein METZ01_LOCUS242420 [marine metagenome]|uniref:AlpA family phage regulatory protein n=1 Tax=marine metagenome TaxID=408172 RepID=A0A382HQG7_9ZZZZ
MERPSTHRCLLAHDHRPRMEKTGTFPLLIRIGNGSVGWLKHEVEKWLTRRMAVRVEDERETT